MGHAAVKLRAKRLALPVAAAHLGARREMEPPRPNRRTAFAAVAVLTLAALTGASGALDARAMDAGVPESLARRRAALEAAAPTPVPEPIAGALARADGALVRLEAARQPRVRRALVDLADATLTLAERRLALVFEARAKARVEGELARERDRARQLRGALEQALVRRAGAPGPASPGVASDDGVAGTPARGQDPAGSSP